MAVGWLVITIAKEAEHSLQLHQLLLLPKVNFTEMSGQLYDYLVQKCVRALSDQFSSESLISRSLNVPKCMPRHIGSAVDFAL